MDVDVAFEGTVVTDMSSPHWLSWGDAQSRAEPIYTGTADKHHCHCQAVSCGSAGLRVAHLSLRYLNR